MQEKRTILFGITGDALSMDATAAIRLLLRDGYNVQVMLTREAQRYVSERELMQLTGNAVVYDMFPQPPKCTVDHIELAKAADCFVVAPATKDFARKLAQGVADDMLLTTALAVTAPRVLFPLPDVRPQDIDALRLLDYAIVEPEYLESPRNAIYRVASAQAKPKRGRRRAPAADAEALETLEAVVCDLDGSLLNSQKQVHPEDLAVIERLKRQGVKFFVATGRHFALAKQTVSAVGFDYPVCACNGAHIYDYSSARTLFASDPMPGKIVAGLLDFLVKRGISFLVYTTDMVVFDSPASRRSLYWKQQREAFEESNRFEMHYLGEEGIDLQSAHVLKFLLAYVDESVERELQRRFNSKGELVMLYSGKDLLDINVAGASKGAGVRELARLYDFKLSNTLVLGDNYNDVSMLEICGMPVVPENGEDSVKSLARYITADNDSAPLSHAIAKIYPELLED